jgi:hypothetical protein
LLFSETTQETVEMDDQDPDVAELIARFAGEGITLEDGGEYQWEEFGVGYDPYDDDDVIPDMLNYHLGKTDDPFAKDDVKYRFDVYSFAMGSMDGKQLQFYDVRLIISLRLPALIVCIGHLLSHGFVAVQYQLQQTPHAF